MEAYTPNGVSRDRLIELLRKIAPSETDQLLKAYDYEVADKTLEQRFKEDDYSNVSYLEFNIFMSTYDATYMYSDSAATYAAGELANQQLKRIRELNLHLKAGELDRPTAKDRAKMIALVTGGVKLYRLLLNVSLALTPFLETVCDWRGMEPTGDYQGCVIHVLCSNPLTEHVEIDCECPAVKLQYFRLTPKLDLNARISNIVDLVKDVPDEALSLISPLCVTRVTCKIRDGYRTLSPFPGKVVIALPDYVGHSPDDHGAHERNYSLDQLLDRL